MQSVLEDVADGQQRHRGVHRVRALRRLRSGRGHDATSPPPDSNVLEGRRRSNDTDRLHDESGWMVRTIPQLGDTIRPPLGMGVGERLSPSPPTWTLSAGGARTRLDCVWSSVGRWRTVGDGRQDAAARSSRPGPHRLVLRDWLIADSARQFCCATLSVSSGQTALACPSVRECLLIEAAPANCRPPSAGPRA